MCHGWRTNTDWTASIGTGELKGSNCTSMEHSSRTSERDTVCTQRGDLNISPQRQHLLRVIETAKHVPRGVREIYTNCTRGFDRPSCSSNSSPFFFFLLTGRKEEREKIGGKLQGCRYPAVVSAG